MNEIILTGLDRAAPAEEKVNVLRENLQIMILKMIADRGAFRNISFVGGTALRIIYGLNRFSEDLDFSLSNNRGFDFGALSDGLKTDFNRAGIDYKAKTGGRQAVKYAFYKFPGLLHDAGLSPMKSENIAVKIEIDMNPPAGFKTETSLLNRFYIFQVNHYDPGSLFAGKLHACLYRSYTKARDYYDLMWYLTKKTVPNYEQLNNAARQTQKKEINISKENLAELLLERLEKLDFKTVKSDVTKFLKEPKEAELLNLENFKGLLR